MTRSQFFRTLAALFGGTWVVKAQDLSQPGASGQWRAPDECKVDGMCVDPSGNTWVNGKLQSQRHVYRNGECPVCATMAPPIPWDDEMFGGHQSVACLNCHCYFAQKPEPRK